MELMKSYTAESDDAQNEESYTMFKKKIEANGALQEKFAILKAASEELTAMDSKSDEYKEYDAIFQGKLTIFATETAKTLNVPERDARDFALKSINRDRNEAEPANEQAYSKVD
jgi:hypothetical protein